MPPRTAWPGSGAQRLHAIVVESNDVAVAFWRRRTGSIKPGSSASPRADDRSSAGRLLSRHGRGLAARLAGRRLEPLAQGRLRPDAGPPGDARDERHERPLPGAADPDARCRRRRRRPRGRRRRAPGPAPWRSAAHSLQCGDEQRQRRQRRGSGGRPARARGRATRPASTSRAQAVPSAVVPPPGDVRRHADGVAHEPAQAAGQDHDGRRQRGQREHGPAGQQQAPDGQRPAGQVQREPRRPRGAGPAAQPSSRRRPAGPGRPSASAGPSCVTVLDGT